MRSYRLAVSIRTLLAVFVALAVLFAPALTRADEAFAAVPDHLAQMMEAGHCQMPPAGSPEHDRAPVKSCCISMFMAVAIAPAAPPEEKPVQSARPVRRAASLYVNSPIELATPPPRLS